MTQWRDRGRAVVVLWSFGRWKRQVLPQAASMPRTSDCVSAARAGEGGGEREMGRKKTNLDKARRAARPAVVCC